MNYSVFGSPPNFWEARYEACFLLVCGSNSNGNGCTVDL